jgi:peroxiredoxin Q/BCP
MQVGDKAPDFELPASGNKTVRLSDFRGKKTVVVYFYPKDETPGCTVEACKFRDDYEDFTAAGAEVIGVSDDSVASHENFAAKHRLPFLLVSDAGGKVRTQWGVKAAAFGIIKGRVTFVIDREGIVRHRFDSQIRLGRRARAREEARDQGLTTAPAGP